MEASELSLQHWPIERLIAYARNPRQNDHAVDQMAAVIAEFGFRIPVVVKSTGELVDGHMRLKAARKLGLSTVPVVLADELSDAQIKAFRLLANRSATWAHWDEELLALELADLKLAGVDLELTGFDAGEIEGLLEALVAEEAREETQEKAQEKSQDGEQDDTCIPASEPEAQAVTRPGDLWTIHCAGLTHRVLCADAGDAAQVARLAAFGQASLCFTSPPYANQRNYTNANANPNTSAASNNPSNGWDAMMQGVCAAMPSLLTSDAQVLVNLGLVHDNGEVQPYWDDWLQWMRQHGWRRFAWYVWDQGPGLPGDWSGRLAPAFEFVFHLNRSGSTLRRPNKNVPCLFAGKDDHLRSDGTSSGGMRHKDGKQRPWNHVGQVTQDFKVADSVLRIMRHKGKIGAGIDHPAVFPIALPQFVMDCFSQPGDIVYEPFCGSGTSLLAAQRTGRHSHAVEIAPSYVDVTLQRFLQHHPDARVILEGCTEGCTELDFEAVRLQRLGTPALDNEPDNEPDAQGPQPATLEATA